MSLVEPTIQSVANKPTPMVRGQLMADGEVRGLAPQPFAAPVGSRSETLSRVVTAAFEQSSVHLESLRSLRSELMLRWFKDTRRALAVVAPGTGSGGSELIANLAVLFAQLGRKTLVIDANLRRPQQHRLFGFKDETSPGLASVLAGRGSMKDLPLAVKLFDNLAVLCAGVVPPNPQELLGHASFPAALAAAQSLYEVVLVDAPPMLEYADAQLIVARVGGCLVLARRHETRLDELQRVMTQLEPTGATVLGAVVTD